MPGSGPLTAVTLKFLGVGGAFSRSYGTTCSMLTLSGSGARWLLDCGRQAPDQLVRENVSWHDVTGLVVTHVHGDHVYGAEDFAFSRFFMSAPDRPSVRDGGARPRLVAHSAVQAELWEVLAPSLRYLPESDNAPPTGTLAHYFDVLEPTETEPPCGRPWRHSERFVSDDLAIVTRESAHVPGKPSTSVELELGGGRIAWWSGDSTVDGARLADLEPRATVFFHDCTFVEYPGQVHGSFSLLERLPAAVRRKTVLMHHEDDIEAHRQRAESLGFRIGMPGESYDLASGRRVG